MTSRRHRRLLVIVGVLLAAGALWYLAQHLYMWNAVHQSERTGELTANQHRDETFKLPVSHDTRPKLSKDKAKLPDTLFNVAVKNWHKKKGVDDLERQKRVMELGGSNEVEDEDGQDVKTGESSKQRDLVSYCSSLHDSVHHEGLPAAGYKLAALVVISRHGDRSPMYTIPNHVAPKLACHINPSNHPAATDTPLAVNDFNMSDASILAQFAASMDKFLRNQSHESVFRRFGVYPNTAACYGAQLTVSGALQMIKLGRHLRLKYPSLAREARVGRLKADMKSTEYPRTFQSAVALLYGFAGGRMDLFQRTKVRVVKNIYFCSESPAGPGPQGTLADGLVGRTAGSASAGIPGGSAVRNMTCICPGAMKLLATGVKDRVHRTEEKKLRTEVADIFNTTVNSLPWLSGILEVLMAHKCHSLPLPCGPRSNQCIAPEMVSRLWQLSEHKIALDSSDSSVLSASRLLAQPLLADIAQRLIDASSYLTRATAPKLIVYSAHDKTLLVLLRALGLRDVPFPVFASRVVFELHSTSSVNRPRYFVRVLYNGRDLTSRLNFCQTASFDDATGLCPLDNFMYAVYMPDDVPDNSSRSAAVTCF